MEPVALALSCGASGAALPPPQTPPEIPLGENARQGSGDPADELWPGHNNADCWCVLSPRNSRYNMNKDKAEALLTGAKQGAGHTLGAGESPGLRAGRGAKERHGTSW